MGRPRKNPYPATDVYAEYWEHNKMFGTSVCMYTFSKTFIRKSKGKYSCREMAQRYVDALKELLQVDNKTCELKVKTHTYIINP